MIPDSLPFSVAHGVATVDWPDGANPQRYDYLLRTTCRLAFANPQVRRVEVSVPGPDVLRRRSLHRTGFRLEAVRRARLAAADGTPLDELGYARLRHDVVDGAAGFTAVMNTVTPRKRVIGHLLFTDGAGRVCLLETSFKDDWELPGGILDVRESPRAGVIREIREELGYTASVGRLLVVDWLPPYLGWEDAVELVFDGGVLTERSKAMLRPDLKEIRAVHWLTVERAQHQIAPFARGRLLAALAAREGRTAYLEGGEPIS